MRSSFFRCLSLLFIVGLLSCTAPEPVDTGIPRVCGQDRTSIDFGVVNIGESLVETVTISARRVLSMDDHLIYTLILDHPDFHLWDPVAEEALDEFLIDLEFPEEVMVSIRFSPSSGGNKSAVLVLGNDCDDLSLAGRGGVVGEWAIDGQPTEYDLYDIWGSSTQTFVCGDHGVVANKVGWDGSWSVMAGTGISDIPILSCWGFEGDIVWFVGGISDFGMTYAKAHRYVLAAETWAEFLQSTMLDHYGSVWGASECDVYFGGSAIGGFMPNFAHWDCVDYEEFIIGMEYDPVSGIFGSGADDIWAVQANAYDSLYHYDGDKWESTKEAFMTQALYDVWVASGGETFAVGANGAIYYFDGTDWLDHTLPSSTDTLFGVWGANAMDVYAVGTKGSIYHYDGNIWQAQTAPSGVTGNLYAVWGRSANEIYAVGEDGCVIICRSGE